jgi:hypothetical protein
MLEHGIHRLLTFNGADFSRFAGLSSLSRHNDRLTPASAG